MRNSHYLIKETAEELRAFPVTAYQKSAKN